MKFAKILFLIIAISGKVLGQISAQDSLKNVIENTDNDSLKSEAYYSLAKYASKNDIRSALEYAQKSASLAEKANSQIQHADALNYIGILYYGIGNYEKTLDYFYQVLAIHEKRQDSLKLAKIYNNVGLILTDLGRIEETIDYYEKSLKIKVNWGDSLGIASTYSNLGLAYELLNELDTGMLYFKKSLLIDRKFNDVMGIYVDLSNIGTNFMKRESYDSAQIYYEGAMALIDKIDEPYNKAELLERFGRLNVAQKQYNRAIEKYNTSISIAEGIDAKSIVRDNYDGLSKVHKILGDYNKSLDYYEKYVAIQDELFSEEVSRKLNQVESNFQILTRENKIDLLSKEAEIKDLRLANNKMVMYWMSGLIALIVVIIILQYRKNVYKNKTYGLLRSQNEEIVEKNKNIMDSIMCAKNIQQAILPNDDILKRTFSDAFVMSKARDVVNGDFYWFAEKEDKLLVAAVDCTGHGVPAAFLNVLGNSLLNQIVNESKTLNPSSILVELNARVINTLHTNKFLLQVDDGMDIGICLYDKKAKELSFAGANRPLYLFQNKKLEVIKGDRLPVGGVLYDAERNYKEHTIKLEKDDLIFLFTDGIVDQFGGDKNKKFMYHRLKSLLHELLDLSLDEQKSTIEKSMEQWQGRNEQTDDMLLIGLRV